ncbi:MAG: veratrol--corrinoid protein metyltransferase [Firmicutes bacterium]|nr:veratrol--corrinoid protein metyltransferase [Bacillota bacterium]
MLTEKENYMMMIRGEHPEWVPYSRFGPSPSGAPPPTAGVLCSYLMGHLTKPGVAKDIWGVTHIPVEEAGGGKIPEPNNFILKDIRQWRDFIKAPDISHIDFEMLAKKDLEEAAVNRNETAVVWHTFVGFFQTLVAFMGFTEALCAMYEEPEEVKSLMEYLCDFYVDFIEKSIDYYKPDIFGICEDNAAWKGPFFSLEMYRDLFKPYTMRLVKPALERGIPVDMHNCGRCEDFVDEWIDYGVVSWNPAQTCNDVLAIKKKYGNKLVIIGAWDARGELANEDVSEEVVKESVYRTIDKYAPGGAYVFSGGFLGSPNDEKTQIKNRWIAEAAEQYCRDFYKKNR